MKKKMWKIVLLLLSPALLFGIYVLAVILYGTITDWKPQEQISLHKEGASNTLKDSTYSFLNWNIGYSGLGAEADFFYDGGKNVRSPKDKVQEYLNGIYGVIKEYQKTDFILLQEVDIKSKRSYKVNQFEGIGNLLPDYSSYFGTNYKAKFVPLPFTKPLGAVNSGIASYSKYVPTEATRYQFPGNFGWPKRVFFLDRCFLLQRHPLVNGKELVVINTHNSAYDDGSLKKQQMDYLKNVLLSEYEQGNYVVVGGDWNQCPPGFQFDHFSEHPLKVQLQTNISADYLPGWEWVYDINVATNRKLSAPYTDKTFTTIIDFYLVSPNVEVTHVKGINTDFAFSDHQPVYMQVKLK